jgi:antitoxin component of MazEF toxin-antitoxin module
MLTIKTLKKDYIAIPENLLSKLGIEEGEKVDIKVHKDTLIITKEKNGFLALEGALKDIDIESPIKELNKKWKKWKPLKSL